MYKNLPTLDDVKYMSSTTDLKNSLRWCIRQIEYLDSKAMEDKPKPRPKMEVDYTAFGKTKSVRVSSLHNMEDGEVPDEVLWVDRGEDWYALQSPQLKDKKVAVIEGRDWRNAETIG